MTFSIVGRSDDGESWGVAVASRFLAVGAVVPAAVAGLGALATQADINVAWKGEGLSLLDDGAPADVVVERLVADDFRREHRQLGVVDADGHAATHTGAECGGWAGGLTEEGVAIQGNLLVGPEVLEQMLLAWHAHAEAPLAHRLLAALRAGDDAGGDRRGRQSSALFVVQDEAGYGGGDDVVADLRVDDHPAPVTELARLLSLNDFHLTPSSEDERMPVDDTLHEELQTRARQLGHADFASWVLAMNHGLRADPHDRPTWIDVRLLGILREQATA